MLDYSRINKPDFKYTLGYRYLKNIHNRIYYRRYEVVGKENLPEGEGFLVIGNHQNGLLDALGILFATGGRTTTFIARGDIFKKDFIGKLLRFLRIMPAFRKRDACEEGVGGNEEIFLQSARIISEGDIVALFPEGGHQHDHHLGMFKKGFARIAFIAAEKYDFKKPLKIVPIGNHYDNYFGFRSNLVINIGEPFEFTELYDIYKEHPERARYLLTQKGREKVNPLMLDISDADHYDGIHMICELGRKRAIDKLGLDKKRFYSELKADQATTATMKHLAETNPERFEKLVGKGSRFRACLEKLNLRSWILERKAWRFIPTALAWLVLLPLWVAAFAINYLPFNAGKLFTKNVKDRMLHPSFSFAVGALISFPLTYLVLFAAIWIATKKFLVAFAALLLLPLTIFPFYYGYIWGVKLWHRLRHSLMKCRRNADLAEAERLKKEIEEGLASLS